jgi:AraC-like DNA-binding protein
MFSAMAEPRHPGITLSGAWTSYVLRSLEELGLDGQDLAEAIGADLAILRDPEVRVPRDTSGQLWRAAIKRTQDPFLGLHAGEKLRFGANNVLVLAALTAENVYEGLRSAINHQRALAHGAVAEVELQASGCKVSLRRITTGLPVTRHEMEFMVVAFRRFCELMLGRPVDDFQEVAFSHRWGGDAEPHRQAFGCKVHFGAPEDYFVIPRALALAPSPHGNRLLHSRFEEAAEERARMMPESFAARAATEIRALMHTGCTVENVADALHVSRRSLQRRLREEGHSFREMVQICRQDIAIHCLTEGMTTEEAARHVGFSSIPAFRRAFYEWTGRSPTEFDAAQ